MTKRGPIHEVDETLVLIIEESGELVASGYHYVARRCDVPDDLITLLKEMHNKDPSYTELWEKYTTAILDLPPEINYNVDPKVRLPFKRVEDDSEIFPEPPTPISLIIKVYTSY